MDHENLVDAYLDGDVSKLKLEKIETVIDKYIKESCGKDHVNEETEYQAFFKQMLAKKGVKSPSQLNDADKKKFFASIKNAWAAQKRK